MIGFVHKQKRGEVLKGQNRPANRPRQPAASENLEKPRLCEAPRGDDKKGAIPAFEQ